MIALVRHGETEPNRDGLLLGRSDPPLTEVGRAQATALAARLASDAPGVVLTSPLRRARETAEVVARACGVDVAVDERLVELDYGAWEGRAMLDVPASERASWRADGAFAPPGGESLADVRDRVVPLVRDLLAAGRSAVAVSHVSPIKAAVAWALDVDDAVAWRMHLSVASITRVAARGDGSPYLVTFNETGHLAGRA